MWSLTALLIVLAIANNQVLANNFIKSALENLQRHQDKQQQLADNYQQSGDGDNNAGSLSLQDLGNLLGLVYNAASDDVSTKRAPLENKRNKKQKLHFKKLNEQALDKVLGRDKRVRTETKNRKKSLLDLLTAGDDETDNNDPDDNSRVYLIFDESESENSLNDLVSTLLKSSSPSQKERSAGREPRYKGFRVGDSYRKARGDSNEKFASYEEIEKPKRPRAYGGWVKGRTAIPYIKNRGDIYEKDD